MAGILNPAQSTCFVASTVQLLAGSSPIYDIFLQHKLLHNQSHDKCHTCALAQVMNGVNSGSQQDANFYLLLPLLEEFRMKITERGDAREFLHQVLSEVFPTCRAMFLFKMEITRRCNRCFLQQKRSCPDEEYLLNIPNGHLSIQSGVEAAMFPSILDEYKCKRCQWENDVLYTCSLTSLPRCLLIHNVGAGGLIVNDLLTVQKVDYYLAGFVKVKGTKDNTRHYTTVRLHNSAMYEFDDECVSKFKITRKKIQAYLLVYIRMDGESQGSPKDFSQPDKRVESTHNASIYDGKNIKHSKVSNNTRGKLKRSKPADSANEPDGDSLKTDDTADLTPKAKFMKGLNLKPLNLSNKNEPVTSTSFEVDPPFMGPKPKEEKDIFTKPDADSDEDVSSVSSVSGVSGVSSRKADHNSDIEVIEDPNNPKLNDDIESTTLRSGKKVQRKTDVKRKIRTKKRRKLHTPIGHKRNDSAAEIIDNRLRSEDSVKGRKLKNIRLKLDRDECELLMRQGTIHSGNKKTIATEKKIVPDKPKRKYCKFEWKTVGIKKSKVHMSMVPNKSKVLLPRNQAPEGNCILCNGKFYTESQPRMMAHYVAVHYKRTFVINHYTHLLCKCIDVKGRGASNRNGHHHCPECWKPSMRNAEVKIHLISKHGYKSEDVKET